MAAEQRVIGQQKIGARPAPIAPPEPIVDEEPVKEAPKGRRGRRVLLVVLAVVVVLAAAGAAFFLLGRGDGAPAEPPPEPAPVPGEVMSVGPVSVNLADGHYLRLGLALQLTADVEEAPDPARALDLAIALYSGLPVVEVTDPATRDELKAQLLGQLQEAYEGEVMDVYLTDYVTQ